MEQHTQTRDGDPRASAWVLTWFGIVLMFVVTSAISLSASAAELRKPANANATAARSALDRAATPPQRLSDTGLYADFARGVIADDVLPFTPQYPLWTDGAAKRRWIRLPKGASIDGSNPDVWRFPVGTMLWKEFSFGRRVETRTMELGGDGKWVYATYVWNADGTDAELAPEYGVRGACTTEFGTRHDVPGVADCRACHTGAASEVLGFSALQLSSDRDPLAPHAEQPMPGSVDLAELVNRGLLRGLPARHVETPPRIAASSPRERAALGYLHGNCGSCHNATGSLASLGLELDYPIAHAENRTAPAIRTTLGRPSHYQIWRDVVVPRVEAGAPDRSTLIARVGSRSPVASMPPLGSRAVDSEALELLRAWISVDVEAQRAVADANFKNAMAAVRNSAGHSDRNERKHR